MKTHTITVSLLPTSLKTSVPEEIKNCRLSPLQGGAGATASRWSAHPRLQDIDACRASPQKGFQKMAPQRGAESAKLQYQSRPQTRVRSKLCSEGLEPTRIRNTQHRFPPTSTVLERKSGVSLAHRASTPMFQGCLTQPMLRMPSRSAPTQPEAALAPVRVMHL